MQGKVTNQRFSPIRWVDETGSTNLDLLADAAAGLPAGAVLVADHQTAGRGRQGRVWLDDPGRSLLFSVLLRPAPATAGLVPLVMGMAVSGAVDDLADVATALKWPNDVLVPTAGERKLAGILSEAATGPAGFAVVVGTGINVSFGGQPPAEVADRAVDLASIAGRPVDRAELLDAILGRLGPLVDRLDAGDAVGLLDDYRTVCATLGRSVRLDTPGGELTGTAVAIDPSGGLVVESDGVTHVVLAGDAHHLA